MFMWFDTVVIIKKLNFHFICAKRLSFLNSTVDIESVDSPDSGINSDKIIAKEIEAYSCRHPFVYNENNNSVSLYDKPLLFWKSFANNYPYISKVARIILSIPATSHIGSIRKLI